MKRRSLARVLSSHVVVGSVGALTLAMIGCGDAPSSTSAGSSSASSSTAATTPRTSVSSSPKWAKTSTYVGKPEATEKMTLHVFLAMQNRDAAVAEAAALNDPDSATFGQYLTADDFHAKYAPTTESLTAVRNWVEGQGLHVEVVADDRSYVRVSGAVQDVEKAFQTEVGKYQVGMQTLRATVRPATIPGELSASILAVNGLHDRSHHLQSASIRNGADLRPGGSARPASTAAAKLSAGVYTAPPPPGYRMPPGCTEGYGQKIADVPPFGSDKLPVYQCSLHPKQVRTLYGLEVPDAIDLDGQGVTVAIVDGYAAAPTLFADSQEYAKKNDPQHPLRASQYRALVSPVTDTDPPSGDAEIQGWYGEQTLDVEMVHAAAPGANILYVGTNGPLDDDPAAATLDWIIDHDLATIISNSWYEPEDDSTADTAPYSDVALHANLRGVGLYFAAGDYGDNSPITDDGLPSAGFPASIPGFTAVGGTSVATDARGDRLFETAWAGSGAILTPGTTDADGTWGPPYPGFFFSAGGGGTSSLYAEPSYQLGIVPKKLTGSGAAAHRAIPDVSLIGNGQEAGVWVGETQVFPDGTYYDEAPVSGTSVSTPIFAGIMARAEQAKGSRVGFANPALYRYHDLLTSDIVPQKRPGVVFTAYNDGTDDDEGSITLVSLPDYEQQSLSTAIGYDSTTGLGTPNSDAIIAYYATKRFGCGPR